MRPGSERIDSETARLIDERLERLLAEAAPRRATSPADGEGAGLVEPDPPKPKVSDPSPPAARPMGWDRRQLSATHLGILVGVVVVALLGSGWAVLRARPVPLASPVSVQPNTAEASPTRLQSPSAGASPGSARAVVVHVLGAVKRPGLVQLPDRSRVQDAIAAAGGLRRNADPGQLNLAQPVSDGQQIIVGTVDDPVGELRPGTDGGGGSTPGASGSATLDLNSATAVQLEALPGVGPVTAAKIIAWRDQHGRFSRVEELQEVAGIGPKTYAEIAPHCRV